MICENCKEETEKKYGSGRFCSQKCSRSFSTKAKREEINLKVCKTFKEKGFTKNKVDKICEYCRSTFSVKYKKRNQKTCSIGCSRKLTWSSDERRMKASFKTCERNSNGDFSNTFKSNRCFFNFNGIDIRCDSLLEFRGLEEICKLFNVSKIERSQIYIRYEFSGKVRLFNPDFLIETEQEKILMECKSRISKNDTNKNSRPLYFLTCEEKKKAMFEFCEENDLKPIWYNGNKIKL